jgi:hypothetical protein
VENFYIVLIGFDWVSGPLRQTNLQYLLRNEEGKREPSCGLGLGML